MNIVSKSIIEQFNPCADRLRNYASHYSEQSFTPAEFLALDKITHADKCWVAFRMMPKTAAVAAAADIAESVLTIYEGRYPGDLRPRQAIEAARKGARNAADARAAYAAAADAADARAAYAADAAVAAAYAAYAAADADADAYAYAAADAAADASAASADARTIQEQLNLQIILKHWEGRAAKESV